MTHKIKHKAITASTALLITALTTSVAVYAGVHINATAPGSVLAQAVPVGVSTVQQMLLMVWTEYAERLKKTCTA